jgi:7-cyano-7-deazaguanine synthase
LRAGLIPFGKSDLVLASGGIDSSALLALARAEGMRPKALFVDYGQAAASAEEAAVAGICSDLGICLQVVRYRSRHFGAGELRGRNAFLLQTALLEFRAPFGTIMMGIHAGTGYRDCSREFVEVMQRSFDFHAGGSISVAAPFIDWTKGDICRLALALDVPIRRTYSCEAGNVPCGRCRSCVDRQALSLEVPGDRT